MFGQLLFAGWEGVSVWVVFGFHKVDTSIMSRCHFRVELGCSPFDGGHKDSIRTALVSGTSANTSGKNLIRNIPRGEIWVLICPVFKAFHYSKRPWQQGMSHIQFCGVLHCKD
eukprot:1137630-Pelagomonas_calceolata.AAC.4